MVGWSESNRLSNIAKNDYYCGKYTNRKHLVSDDAIRHMTAEHGDFVREALRAQLALRETDIARTLSAIKDNRNPDHIEPSRSKSGGPSLVIGFEVNGYTLYAEQLTRPLGNNLPSDLIGHTMYKAPTLSTAAVSATSAATLPKRQNEVLCDHYTSNGSKMSSDYFVADGENNPALLHFSVVNDAPVADLVNGGLIALSSNAVNLNGNTAEGYVRCKKPY